MYTKAPLLYVNIPMASLQSTAPYAHVKGQKYYISESLSDGGQYYC